jgi:hypothetical protein
MKVHELAKRTKRLTPKVMELLQRAGYTEYTGINCFLKHPVAELEEAMNVLEQEDRYQLEVQDEACLVNLVGMWFNPLTRQYHTTSVKMPVEEFKRLGGGFGKGYSTVYSAQPEFNGLLDKQKVLYPVKLKK